MKFFTPRGYTLVELIVAVGLFTIVMMLAAGAYFTMINLTRQTQNKATGINNLSFALETMTRTIRTGTSYSCNGGGDCSGGSSFSLKDMEGNTVSYALSDGVITQNAVPLTDSSAVVSALKFYVSGTVPFSSGEYTQPYVTIAVSGTVSSGGKNAQSFSIETSAAMRGFDLGAAPPPPAAFSATGGTITYTDSNGLNPRSSPAYDGGYTVHTFTSGGTFVVSSGFGTVEYLVVAGGGGGGYNVTGGGGGAGGVRSGTLEVSAGSIAVTVGGGGGPNANGGDSVFSSINSTGGGRGGSANVSPWTGVGGNGGSGGGGSSTGAGGSGTAGQGNNGGYCVDPYTYSSGGGGGGAGAAGHSTGYSCGGDGGVGISSSISGVATYRGGGGGGGGDVVEGGCSGGGGTGGGGNGAYWSWYYFSCAGATVGAANTGGGGGGGPGNGSYCYGASGGSGIVIVRYPTP